MQQVRVKEIKSKVGKIKAGVRAGQDYELIIIIGEDGSEFTTFDTAIKEVGTGGLLELEAEIKNNKTNIITFKILETSTKAEAPPLPSAKESMTPELWAEKQQVERHSIETQVAFKGIIELAIAYVGKDVLTDGTDKFQQIYEAALGWAMAHFQPTKPAPEATKSKSTAPKPETDSPLPKPAEILQGHCKTLGWGDDEWHDYLFKNFKGAKKYSDLSDKDVIVAINNLRAMVQVKEAGETSELVEIEPEDLKF